MSMPVAAIGASAHRYTKHERASLAITIRQTIKAVYNGDLQAFRKLASDDGVQVVRRWVMYPDPFTDKDWSPPYFSLNGLSGTTHGVDEVDFDQSEIDSGDFKRIFDKFHHMVVSYSYPTSPEWSTNFLVGSGDERRLGPAVGNKMASNWFWVVRFDRENGRWKIWQILVDYTH